MENPCVKCQHSWLVGVLTFLGFATAFVICQLLQMVQMIYTMYTVIWQMTVYCVWDQEALFLGLFPLLFSLKRKALSKLNMLGIIVHCCIIYGPQRRSFVDATFANMLWFDHRWTRNPKSDDIGYQLIIKSRHHQHYACPLLSLAGLSAARLPSSRSRERLSLWGRGGGGRGCHG